MRQLFMLAITLALHTACTAAPTSVLFAGNCSAFGRINPVMSDNTAHARDLTAAYLAAIGATAGTCNLLRGLPANACTNGLIDLWFDDGTHASAYGSYLSALTLCGTPTGLNPIALGAAEKAARDLSISSKDAVLLQRIAAK